MSFFKEFQVNFVVAIVIASLSFIWAWSHHAIRRRVIQRKYQVAGRYLSYFEDCKDDRVVWVKAPLRVRQRGKDVAADGLDMFKQRDTDTHGKITPNGSIIGTYGRKNPNDPAKGVVFLEPDPVTPGLYRGFYSGYDSTLRRLVSGRYVWRRLHTPRIAKVTADTADSGNSRAIFGDLLGSRYAADVLFRDALHEERGKVILGAWVGERMVGCLLLDAQPAIDLAQLKRLAQAKSPVENPGLHQNGVIHALAVLPDARGRGVATSLLRAASAELQNRSCTAVISTVWRASAGADDPGIRDEVLAEGPPSGIDWSGASPANALADPMAYPDLAGRLLRTEGFRLIGRLVDVPPPTGGCSECPDPCMCEGWVYFKSLGDTRLQAGRGAGSLATKTSTG